MAHGTKNEYVTYTTDKDNIQEAIYITIHPRTNHNGMALGFIEIKFDRNKNNRLFYTRTRHT
jgi:N-acetylmuramoyl-L-alanine amidase CwlA